jgi:hypothetical protein
MQTFSETPSKLRVPGSSPGAPTKTSSFAAPSVIRDHRTTADDPQPVSNSFQIYSTRRPIAALFVLSDGPYAGIDGVDIWDQVRDARTYAGPHRVVAHPPCERWGRYWHGGPSARVRRVKGDDGGCFAAALAAVRKWGGILEHPAASSAWDAFRLLSPMRGAGWTVADFEGGFTCCVDQEHYGHRAQKATWLYAVGVPLPSLNWEKGTSRIRLDDGFHSAEERRRATRTGICQRLSKRQRLETPAAFRDLLISIARGEAA